jgi:cellulose synthase/poly-beta-1,6-N-acetylglucosamine synthase-like glycosyltransferase
VREEASVSFVVIAYNEARNIAATIRAITGLEGLGKHEVIVVDDGSRDGTADIVTAITRRDPAVRLIRLAENHGRGYARDTGIADARGDLIATVDADIILPRDWLVRARSALRDHDAVGGTAVPDGDVAYLYRRFGLTPRMRRHTTTVAGGNGLYRSEVFTSVRFDPALREGEDVALNHAIERHGLSCATIPGLIVEHRETKTWAESLRWMFHSGRGATRQLLVYRQVRQPDVATGAFAAAVAMGVLAAARTHPAAGALIPVTVVLAASAQHVRSRFQTPRADWPRVMPAIAADSALLTAYFAGRLAGLVAVQRGTGIR